MRSDRGPAACDYLAAGEDQRAHVSTHNKLESVFDVEPHTQINPGSPRMEAAHRGGASQLIISHLKHLELAGAEE